jgi:hypothetical protein
MTAFPTGNLARDGAITAVLRELMEQGEPTYQAAATLCNRYGASFDGLGLDEYNEALAIMNHPLPVPGNEAEQAEPVAEPEPRKGVKAAEVESRPLSLVEAQAALNDWQVKTQLARTALRDADMAQRTARSKLVESLNFFLRGGPLTPEQMKREYLASEQQKRINGERRGGRTGHGPSVFDHSRAHQSSVNRNYAPKRRPDMMTGRRTYSIADSVARSGSGIIDTPGIVAVPAAKSE